MTQYYLGLTNLLFEFLQTISLLFQIKKRKKKTGLTLNYHYSTLYRCNYVSNNLKFVSFAVHGMNSYLNEIISVSLRVNYKQNQCVNECHFTFLLIVIDGMINWKTKSNIDNQK